MQRIVFFFTGLTLLLSVSQTTYTQIVGFEKKSVMADDIVAGKEDSIPSLLNAKAVAEANMVWNDSIKSQYFEVVSSLAEYTSAKGLFKEEEAIIQAAISQYEEKDSTSNSEYMRGLWLFMCKLQGDLRDFQAVITYGKKALRLYELAQDYDFSYVMVLHNLAVASLKVGNLLDAKLYSDEAMAQINELLGRKSISVEWSYPIVNLHGLVEVQLGHYDKAIKDFKSILHHALPSQHQAAYVFAQNNLATILYVNFGKYEEARSIFKSMNPVNSDLAILKYQNLALLDYLSSNNQDAYENLKNYNHYQFQQSEGVISAFSELEREEYLSNSGKEIVLFNNMFAYRFPKVSIDAFNACLFSQGVNVAINKALRDYVNTETVIGEDTVGSHLNYLYKVAKMKTLPITERCSVRDEIVDVEKALLRSCPQILNSIKVSIGNWLDIQRNLKKNEALVMFCYLPEVDGTMSITPNFGAYVSLPSDSRPRLVKLCNVDSVESLYLNYDPSSEFISELYSPAKAHALYSMLWKPLEKVLKGANNIYFSTCGTLGILNHEALVDDEGHRMGDKRNMVKLSTPTEMQNFKAHKRDFKPSEIALFGAPSFNLSLADMGKEAIKYQNYTGQNLSTAISLLRGELMRDGWNLLPGTKKEVNEIYNMFYDKNIEARMTVGNAATEEAIKALSGHSPQILHIATHGFNIATKLQQETSDYAKSVSGLNERMIYMQWSGLVLAGGNNTWLGKAVPADVEDGILTADEISHLDLSGTKLVVLSACDTGLGHIDPLEGVLGLQRAFKQAGVESILMTLWKIPDSTTAMFMEKFYERLLAGDTVRQAVKAAQQHLISSGASDPFYWAAFTVLD